MKITESSPSKTCSSLSLYWEVRRTSQVASPAWVSTGRSCGATAALQSRSWRPKTSAARCIGRVGHPESEPHEGVRLLELRGHVLERERTIGHPFPVAVGRVQSTIIAHLAESGSLCTLFVPKEAPRQWRGNHRGSTRGTPSGLLLGSWAAAPLSPSAQQPLIADTPGVGVQVSANMMGRPGVVHPLIRL